mmetsp:Transcript_25025/g.38301  ORF Transcript_25025/g.38301 Transcript_25025/m.38301 type:complete len:125 (+) Transcript_25025:85-459(+)
MLRKRRMLRHLGRLRRTLVGISFVMTLRPSFATFGNLIGRVSTGGTTDDRSHRTAKDGTHDGTTGDARHRLVLAEFLHLVLLGVNRFRDGSVLVIDLDFGNDHRVIGVGIVGDHLAGGGGGRGS